MNTMKEKIQTKKLTPGTIDQNDPSIIDVTPTEVEREMQNLSPEEKEKIGWGLSTIGFKVEKAKDDFFAGAFDKSLSKINKKGTVGRFCTELRDSFIRDSKNAVKKAADTKSGKEKHRLSNAGLLSGNLLRYGRVITDLTGASLASPLRYVMMAGMATTRLAEAGKEARLKNEDVIEKTRIQDADLASEEAWKIYQNAQKKIESGENKNVSVEALKNAYMMEMPKDLQERLKNPSTANSFIQDVVKTDLQFTINMLNKKIEKIENNSKLSPEQKETEKEKLITKQKKNLEDYDRIITQYGTVDALAMAGRYAQTVGKTVVAVVTVETLVLSAEKIFGTVSNIYHHFGVPVPRLPGVEPEGPVSALEQPPTSAAGSPETPPAINGDAIVHQGQGIEHPLIKQIDANPELAQELGFKGDINDKIALHKFAGQEAHRIAEKMGYVGKGGQEIHITEADKVAFELKVENGHPVVTEKTINGEIIGTYDKEEGYEFGKNADNQYEKEVNITHHQPVHHNDIEKNEPTPPPEKVEPVVTETHTIEPNPVDKARENVTNVFDNTKTEKTDLVDPLIKKPSLGYQTVHIGTTYSTGSEIHTGSEVSTGSEMSTGSYSGIYPGNQQPVIFNGETYYPDSNGQYHDAFSSKPYFRELTDQENLVLQHHPEFAENPFNLSGKELIKTYGAIHNDENILFKNETLRIGRLSLLKADRILKYADEPNIDPTTKRLSDYLNLLKNFTGLEPKSGFLGVGSETSQHYIGNAYQKLAADGNLEKFQEILRK